jgi:hypothetical protein
MTLSLCKNGLSIIDYNTNPNAGISAGSEIMYKNFGAAFSKDIGSTEKSSEYGKTGIEGLQLCIPNGGFCRITVLKGTFEDVAC